MREMMNCGFQEKFMVAIGFEIYSCVFLAKVHLINMKMSSYSLTLVVEGIVMELCSDLKWR